MGREDKNGNELQKLFTIRPCFSTKVFFLPSSRIRVDLLSYQSKPADKRGQYNSRAEKNLDGFFYLSLLIAGYDYTYISSERTFTFPWLLPDKVWSPIQIFLSPPVALLSFISQYALIWLQIDSNITGSQKKNWSSCLIWTQWKFSSALHGE